MDDPEPCLPDEPRPEFTFRVHGSVTKCVAGHTYSCSSGLEEHIRPTPCPHCVRDKWAKDNAKQIAAHRAWVRRAPVREAKERQRQSMGIIYF